MGVLSMSKSLDRVKEIMQLGWPALTVNGLMFGNILILQWHAEGVQWGGGGGRGGGLPTGAWMKGARNFQILSSCFRNYITILSFKLKILFIVRSACFKSLHSCIHSKISIKIQNFENCCKFVCSFSTQSLHQG